MPWNPECYTQFKNERYTPFEDLFQLIQVREGMSVVDLGCGTGELTQRLAEHLPGSEVLGVDSSTEMLEKAQKFVRPGLKFELGTIEAIQGTWDLVFSHAAIHWVEDHHSLIPKLCSLVKPGGQLAVQLPSNHKHPAHTTIHEIAQREPFRSSLDGWVRHSPVLGIDEYAELLFKEAGPQMAVIEKVYPHVLADSDAIAEWTSGTTLVPYFERLPKELHDLFMEQYRDRLRELWPSKPVFYGFRRTLFAARWESER